MWSLYQNEMEVNSVTKSLKTVKSGTSPVKILVDTGSCINLLDEETFKSRYKYPTLTKERNPVIPYAGRPMAYGVVARKGLMITAKNERHVVTRNVSRFNPVNVKMDSPMESDSMEDDSTNDDVPTEVSEAEDSATPGTEERSR